MGKVSQDLIANEKKQIDSEILNQMNRLGLNSDKKETLISTIEMYSGPIPHPTILAGYQSLYSDASKEIIQNGIEESKHRRKLEIARQKRRGRLAWVAMCSMVVSILVFMIGSFVLVMNGNEIVGGIFGGGSFISLVSILNSSINNLSKNNDRKSKSN